jgi:hypothetical protein
MRLLTTFPDGSIPFDEEHPRRIDARQVLADWSHDRVETPRGAFDHRSGAGLGAIVERGIGLHDDDLPAGKLQRRGVSPRKAELEHATPPLPATPAALPALRVGR